MVHVWRLPDQEVNPMQIFWEKGPMMNLLIARTRQPMDPIHFGKYSRQKYFMDKKPNSNEWFAFLMSFCIQL